MSKKSDLEILNDILEQEEKIQERSKEINERYWQCCHQQWVGIKIIAEDKYGNINTWKTILGDVGEGSLIDVIEKNKERKGWIGGKITEIYLEFYFNQKYTKIYIDVKKNKINELLKK